MKNIMLITTVLLFVACNFCIAQEKIKVENVNVSNEDDIANSLPRNAVYIFPDFTEGKVFFKNGTTTSAKLNYNTLTEEMQFVDDKENIMAISNPQDIDYVIINKKVFYYVSEKSFGELLANNDAAKLCVKRRTEYTETKSQGAYGQSNATSAITNINATYDFKRSQLSVLRDLTFKIIDEFLLERNGKFTKITGIRSFFKIFPQYKDEITKFVESNKINFKNEKDLIKLTNYCTQLSLVKK
ncbi:MAG: hypothetical protein LBP85_06600 [Prevotellaceae bacterium]|jgi:hypothetical protein|nr:hypothetical protein [Prevotellaceae bacterium]